MAEIEAVLPGHAPAGRRSPALPRIRRNPGDDLLAVARVAVPPGRAPAPPGPAAGAGGASRLLALQRTAGNRATTALAQARGWPGGPPASVQRAGATGTRVSVQRVGAKPQDVATAIADLRNTYPRVREGTHVGLTSGQADEFWQAHLAGKDLARLVHTMLRDVVTDEERTDREVFVSVMFSGGALGLKVEIEGESAEANRTAVNQWFSVDADGELRVELRSVYAPGRGRALMGKGLLPFFDEAGVTRIWLDASGIGGGRDGVFAWARYGFVPFPSYWETMRARGRELLARYQDAEWRGRAASALNSADPRALRHLVELSWTAGDKRAAEFLNLVLQADFTWEGEIDLANAEDRQWIERYAANVQGTVFADLLIDLPPRPQRPARCGHCVIF